MGLALSKHMNSVVALGVLADDDEGGRTGEPMSRRATGFLYGYPASVNQDDDEVGFRSWLITCAHVIRGVRDNGHGEMLVRMNRSARDGKQSFEISLRGDGRLGWFLHPDKDVAVIPASPRDLESNRIEWGVFASGRNALTRDEVVSIGLSEGAEVFVLGFPVGWREGRQDYPIVRHGVLAQVQGWLNGEHETFLVDGSGFPGNSGGPVVTELWSSFARGEVPESSFSLVGMVSCGMTHRVVPGEESDLGEVVVVEESADLIEVIPVDAIDETIRLAMEREE